jgi:hypothetical protein
LHGRRLSKQQYEGAGELFGLQFGKLDRRTSALVDEYFAKCELLDTTFGFHCPVTTKFRGTVYEHFQRDNDLAKALAKAGESVFIYFKGGCSSEAMALALHGPFTVETASALSAITNRCVRPSSPRIATSALITIDSEQFTIDSLEGRRTISLNADDATMASSLRPFRRLLTTKPLPPCLASVLSPSVEVVNCCESHLAN